MVAKDGHGLGGAAENGLLDRSAVLIEHLHPRIERRPVAAGQRLDDERYSLVGGEPPFADRARFLDEAIGRAGDLQRSSRRRFRELADDDSR